MCGIAGELGLDHRPVSRADGVRMIQALAHRGPDGWGFYGSAGGDVMLVHTRLSIVDLEGGAQPLCNEDETIWAVVNGELYGYEAERDALVARGHRFRTRSDSELVVHLYEEFGDAFPERLRGEFAIALWDERKGQLLLVRDRFGIKPLHYYRDDHAVVFGSEVKAIFARRGVPRAFEPAALRDMLGGMRLCGQTAFAGVRPVEPGHVLTIEARDGRTTSRCYWDVPFVSLADERADVRSESALADELRARLAEAVRLRLRADVPVGAYLSGGIDSTAVVALMRRQLGRPFDAFTVGFPDAAYDETEVAAESASAMDVRLHRELFAGDALGAHLMDALWHSEIPVMNAHGAAKNRLARRARQHVKVVLTGEGADEVFAGYSDFLHQRLLDARLDAPHDEAARREAADFVRKDVFPSPLLGIDAYRQHARVVDRLGAYPYQVNRILSAQPLGWLLAGDLVARTPGYDAFERLVQAIGPGRLAGLSSTAATQYVMFKSSLPGYILNFLGDRQEMAHGIEGRVPFLDHPLVAFAAGLPSRAKLDGTHGKRVLRQAVADVVPPGASGRRKKMFLAPLGTFGASDETAALRSELLSFRRLRHAGVVRPSAITLARGLIRWLPPRSRVRGLCELVLATAMSVQALHDLMIEGFEAAFERYQGGAVYGRSLDRLAGCARSGRRQVLVHSSHGGP